MSNTTLDRESDPMLVLAFLQQAVRELSDNEAVYSDKWMMTMDHAEVDAILTKAGLRKAKPVTGG